MIAAFKEQKGSSQGLQSYAAVYLILRTKGRGVEFSNSVSEEIFIEKLWLKKMFLFNEKLTVSLAK